jgi:exonuclease III
VPDVNADYVLNCSDFICLTETHLTRAEQQVEVKNFRPFHVIAGKGKGTSIYARNSLPQPIISHEKNTTHYQILILIYEKTQVCSVYRSQSSHQTLSEIFDFIYDNMNFEKSLIITGDFNIDFAQFPKNPLSKKLSYSDIKQVVNHPTHRQGNILDHVYCHENDYVRYFIHPVYYSDHEALCSIIKPDA